ncbi:MAG: hypothetical protein RSF02_01165 [Bacilli bacterium]
MLFMEGPGTVDGFCAGTASLWQFVGVILLVFKIVIPIVLIIWGMLDLGKAVIASEDKAISKAAKALAMRVLAGMLIFFIPTIISFVFTMVGTFNEDVKDDFDVCKLCITQPNDKSNKDGKTCGDYVR